MARNIHSLIFVSLSILLIVSTCVETHGWKHYLSQAMGWGGGGESGWESKGISFGLKSKGMTAIIPFPLPIPIFSKEKKKDDGGSTGDSDTKGSSGGWEMPSGGSDWWR